MSAPWAVSILFIIVSSPLWLALSSAYNELYCSSMTESMYMCSKMKSTTNMLFLSTFLLTQRVYSILLYIEFNQDNFQDSRRHIQCIHILDGALFFFLAKIQLFKRTMLGNIRLKKVRVETLCFIAILPSNSAPSENLSKLLFYSVSSS